MAPRDGDNREELMRRADLALRTAKRRGRGLIVRVLVGHGDRFRRAALHQARAVACTRRASFEVHYQPIVKADGGAIVGVEALLRWNHVSRGFIPPAVFVRVAEEAGMMDQLGEFVLRKALADAARWPDLYVSVNLSPVQVRDRRFVQLVSRGAGGNQDRTRRGWCWKSPKAC